MGGMVSLARHREECVVAPRRTPPASKRNTTSQYCTTIRTGLAQTQTGGMERQASARARERQTDSPISAPESPLYPRKFSTFLLLAPLSLPGSFGHDGRDSGGLVSIGKATVTGSWISGAPHGTPA
ncbi:hypothetical protein CSUB01_03189 [Colletotrichum sublineola]|uniref:Uncharacterized protein n=1 Tax=Colletotrichum sublineola TaxID=1173701 RepID=A0A066XDC4_COLSU|nr:hypothetical protein CSUB01_03189 [Colletotrichum sublineola]